MKKSIILIACLSCLFIAPINSYASEILVDDYENIITEWLEDKTLKDLIKKHNNTLRKIKVLSDYEYNSKNYFTKRLKTWEVKIPEELEKRISKVEIIFKQGDNNGALNKILGNADAISSEKYSVKKSSVKINYKPTRSYLYNTNDIVKLSTLEKQKRRNGIWLQTSIKITFDAKNSIELDSGYISIDSKAEILRNSLYNEENGFRDIYANINDDVIKTYLNNKYKNISRDEYKERLENMYNSIEKLNKKQSENEKELYKSIVKEEDFAKKKEEFERIISTKNLIKRLAYSINWQIKTLEAYNIIDSLED